MNAFLFGYYVRFVGNLASLRRLLEKVQAFSRRSLVSQSVADLIFRDTYFYGGVYRHCSIYDNVFCMWLYI